MDMLNSRTRQRSRAGLRPACVDTRPMSTQVASPRFASSQNRGIVYSRDLSF